MRRGVLRAISSAAQNTESQICPDGESIKRLLSSAPIKGSIETVLCSSSLRKPKNQRLCQMQSLVGRTATMPTDYVLVIGSMTLS